MNCSSNRYYTYIYLNPEKPGKYSYKTCSFLYEPFYVGKGTGNRCLRHIWRSSWKRETNRQKLQLIKRLLAKGYKLKDYIVKYANHITWNDALLYETELIKDVGQIINNTGPLTNILEHGGRTSSLAVHKKRVQKQKLSWTDERKQTHSKRMRELYHAPGSSLKRGLTSPHDNNGKQISITRKLNFKIGKIKRPVNESNPNSKKWMIVSPTNKQFIIIGTIDKFCKKYKLPPWTMREMTKRSSKYKKSDWKGWKCECLGFANHISQD